MSDYPHENEHGSDSRVRERLLGFGRLESQISAALVCIATLGALTVMPALGEEDDRGNSEGASRHAPNILLILADDLGYSDVGAFGGEIDTPHLDELASEGALLTDFHVAPTCSITRQLLFTGVDDRRRGAPPSPGETRKKNPFFFLNEDSRTFVDRLQANGYHTFMAGKWDLSPKGGSALKAGFNPMDQGFDRAFWLQNGGGSHYADRRHMLKAPIPTINYFSNDKPVQSLPDDFYSSDYYTDKLIEFIEDRQDDSKPFFAFASYTAPHWPLHAPAEVIAKYEATYENGYEPVRTERLRRQRELGLFTAEHTSAGPNPGWPRWEELSEELRLRERKRMQVHAAMVDILDQNIGRLLRVLKQRGEYDNTLILFFSDNGADGNDPADLSPENWLRDNFDNRLENIGLPNSYETMGPNWASVSSTPLKLYKAFAADGGTRSPFIAVHKDLVVPNRVSSAYATVSDIYPTLLAVAGIDPHDPDNAPLHSALPKGSSMLGHFSGAPSVHPEDYVYAVEYWSRKSVRQGPWKATWTNTPFGSERWELFDMRADVGERTDLSSEQPEILESLIAHYLQYAQQAGVVDDPNFEIRYSNTQSFYTR